MAVQLNHTIVQATDAAQSAQFMSEVFGLPKPRVFAHFHAVETANGVSLDFNQARSEVKPAHYAFLVSEPEFDEIFGRVKARGLTYWADPDRKFEGQINAHDGGRGVYFPDPSGHLLEIITKPYGG